MIIYNIYIANIAKYIAIYRRSLTVNTITFSVGVVAA